MSLIAKCATCNVVKKDQYFLLGSLVCSDCTEEADRQLVAREESDLKDALAARDAKKKTQEEAGKPTGCRYCTKAVDLVGFDFYVLGSTGEFACPDCAKAHNHARDCPKCKRTFSTDLLGPDVNAVCRTCAAAEAADVKKKEQCGECSFCKRPSETLVKSLHGGPVCAECAKPATVSMAAEIDLKARFDASVAALDEKQSNWPPAGSIRHGFGGVSEATDDFVASVTAIVDDEKTRFLCDFCNVRKYSKHYAGINADGKPVCAGCSLTKVRGVSKDAFVCEHCWATKKHEDFAGVNEYKQPVCVACALSNVRGVLGPKPSDASICGTCKKTKDASGFTPGCLNCNDCMREAFPTLVLVGGPKKCGMCERTLPGIYFSRGDTNCITCVKNPHENRDRYCGKCKHLLPATCFARDVTNCDLCVAGPERKAGSLPMVASAWDTWKFGPRVLGRKAGDLEQPPKKKRKFDMPTKSELDSLRKADVDYCVKRMSREMRDAAGRGERAIEFELTATAVAKPEFQALHDQMVEDDGLDVVVRTYTQKGRVTWRVTWARIEEP